MSNRRFEMYEYHQALVRMRLGESDRQIAKTGLMGRRKLAQVRETAEKQGCVGRGSVLAFRCDLGVVFFRPGIEAALHIQHYPLPGRSPGLG